MAEEKRVQLALSVYLHGCYRELLALKPGNVGTHAAGHAMTVEQFQHSARVSAPPLCDPSSNLGRRIHSSVRATQNAVGCNTNLGILLLCSPLLQAYLAPGTNQTLQAAVTQVIHDSTVNDAVLCYEAIRLANPGGLGASKAQDVRHKPDVTLLQAMQIAADNDRIAFQYSNEFGDIFNLAMPRLRELRDYFPVQDNWAVTALYLYLLARIPDTHIVRKQGVDLAMEVSQQASELEKVLLQEGPTMSVQKQLQQTDSDFKNAGINPGTTADLVVASLVASQLDQVFTEEQMDVIPNNLQDVEQSIFTTHTFEGGAIWQ